MSGNPKWAYPILFKAICINPSKRTHCEKNEIVWVAKFNRSETVYGADQADNFGFRQPGRTLIALPTYEFLDCFLPADPRDIVKFRDVLDEYKDASYKAWQAETEHQVKLAIGHDRQLHPDVNEQPLI